MSEQENHLPGSVAVLHTREKPLILVSMKNGRALYTNTIASLPEVYLPDGKKPIRDESLGFLTHIKNISPREREFDFGFGDRLLKDTQGGPGYRVIVFPDSREVFSVAPNGGLRIILNGFIERIENDMGYTYHHSSTTSNQLLDTKSL